MEYVVLSPDTLKEFFITIYTNVGTIFSVAIYAFMLVLGVFMVIELVKYFAK